MDLTKMMLNLALGGGTWVLALLIVLSIASVAVMLERARTFYQGRFAEETFHFTAAPETQSNWLFSAGSLISDLGFLLYLNSLLD